MGIKSISLATVCAVFTTVSLNAGAAIIDNGTYTTDTASGLDWLDLTETTSMSYNDVTAQLGAGGSLVGWRYATEDDVVGFFNAFGGDSAFYYSGWSTQNNGLFDTIAPYWGDTYCIANGCAPGEGQSFYLMANTSHTLPDVAPYGVIRDLATNNPSADNDYIDIGYSTFLGSDTSNVLGSALVRDVSTVPVPAAVWLFGSGLLGLVGVARQKKV